MFFNIALYFFKATLVMLTFACGIFILEWGEDIEISC